MLEPTSAAGAIAVIGGGTMGVGIAYVFAVAEVASHSSSRARPGGAS